MAVLTLVTVFAAATVAWSRGRDLRILGYVAMALVMTEFLLGVSAILTGLPIAIAVAHNWLAALILLALLKLFAESSAQLTDDFPASEKAE